MNLFKGKENADYAPASIRLKIKKITQREM